MHLLTKSLKLNLSGFQKWQFIGIGNESWISKYRYKRLGSQEITIYVDWLRSIWFFHCDKEKSIQFGKCSEIHLHPKLTLQHIEIALGNYLTHQRFE